MSNDLEKILAILDALTDSERAKVVAEVSARFCIHCGCKQPEEERCQCWNDE